MIGVPFFVERLLQNPHRIVVAKRLGVAARGAIGCDLVMFDSLGDGNQRRVERLAALRVVEPASAVFD